MAAYCSRTAASCLPIVAVEEVTWLHCPYAASQLDYDMDYGLLACDKEFGCLQET